MKRSYRLAHAPSARWPLSAAITLLVVLAQVTACQPESEPVPAPAPTPDNGSPEQPTGNPPVQTSPFSLTASARDPDTSTEAPPPGGGDFIGVLTTESALGTLDFRYDAYVVTARQTGTVTIQGDVLSANPESYQYGYAYPLNLAAIEEGITMTFVGGSDVQNALETGTAIITYPVVAGRQYILMYKTFGTFTPLKYRLKMSSELIMEGRVHTPPTPVPIPTNSAGPITLENPRPDVLKRFMPWLSERANSN